MADVRPKDHPVCHQWELEKDPDPTGSGGKSEEDRMHRAVLGARFMGLMSEDTDGGGVIINRGMGNLLPPRGLTIKGM